MSQLPITFTLTADDWRGIAADEGTDGRTGIDALVERIMWLQARHRELHQSATAAWHVLQSLLAVREGATDELLIGVRDALRAAIDKAEGK